VFLVIYENRSFLTSTGLFSLIFLCFFFRCVWNIYVPRSFLTSTGLFSLIFLCLFFRCVWNIYEKRPDESCHQVRDMQNTSKETHTRMKKSNKYIRKETSWILSSGLNSSIFVSFFSFVYESLLTCSACHAQPRVSPSCDIFPLGLISYIYICFSSYVYTSLLTCSARHTATRIARGGGLGSRPKKMYVERLGDGVEYHLMSPTPRR